MYIAAMPIRDHSEPAARHDDGVRPRKPWIAGALSFVCPGLGQLYNGQTAKAGVLLALCLSEALLLFAAHKGLAAVAAACVAVAAIHTYATADAALAAVRRPGYALRPFNRGYVYLLIFLAFMALKPVVAAVPARQMEVFGIHGSSMLPTLHRGDRIVARVLEDGEGPPRGALVVLDMPGRAKTKIIKRVVAVPGDTVRIRDKIVYVDGRALSEPYAAHLDEDVLPMRDDFGPRKLAESEYFLLGDNRDVSVDSRFFGPVPRSDLRAVPLYVYWADKPERIGADLR